MSGLCVLTQIVPMMELRPKANLAGVWKSVASSSTDDCQDGFLLEESTVSRRGQVGCV